MSELFIRKALEKALGAMPATLPTIWQNYPPPEGFNADQPHQKAFLLRVKPQSLGLRERTTLHAGIFQVSLCYPAGKGTAEVETRAEQLLQYFAPGQVFEHAGVKVRIRGKATIGDPVTLSPYVIPVSIRYESIN